MVKKISVANIREKSARGIKWQVGTEVLSRMLQLLFTFVLARLLTPTDFGIIGVAFIFTRLTFVLFDLGLSSALIQRKELQKIQLQSAQTVFLLSATVFFVAIYFASPYIAVFFHYARLKSILRVLGTIFFLFALRAIPNVQLTRKMRFKAIGLIWLASVLVYGALAMGFALSGFGVWSFVFGLLGQELTLTLLTLVVARQWLPPAWQFGRLKELTAFGSQVLASRVVGYLNINLPNAIIGRFMGSATLGYYSVGYQLVDFPVQRISKNILRVMFPAFSKLQDNLPQYQQLYKDTVSGLALLVFPVFAGMALVAPEFVSVFYGPKWQALVPVLEILTVVGLARSIWVTTSVVFLSKGKPQWELLINLIYFAMLSFVLFLVYRQGLVVVVTFIALVLLFFVGIALMASLRMIRLSILEWFKLVRTPAFATAAMVGILLGLRLTGIQHWPAVIRLFILVVTGILIYLVTVYGIDRKAFARFKSILGRSS